MIGGSFRAACGDGRDGSFADIGSATNLQSTFYEVDYSTDELGIVGFRLAIVPEPSSVLLAIAGCAGAFGWRKRLK